MFVFSVVRGKGWLFCLLWCRGGMRGKQMCQCGWPLLCPAALCITVCGLAKVAIFTTNVYAENQCLISHKTVCGALKCHFCQTAVSGSLFLSYRIYSYKVLRLLFGNSIFLWISPFPSTPNNNEQE